MFLVVVVNRYHLKSVMVKPTVLKGQHQVDIDGQTFNVKVETVMIVPQPGLRSIHRDHLLRSSTACVPSYQTQGS